MEIINELDSTNGISDDELTFRFNEAIRIDNEIRIIKGLPIAQYDKDSKRAYLEYPDGKREYVGDEDFGEGIRNPREYTMKDRKKGQLTTIDARRDFSEIQKIAEEDGHVVLFENDQPKIMVIDLDKEPQIQMTEDEKFEFVTKRILNEHIEAFKELAK